MPMEDLTCPPGTTLASERDFRWNQGVSKTRIVVFSLQGGKPSLWEGGVRVLSILYWKGVLQPSSSEQMIAVQAVLPTLLSLSGEKRCSVNAACRNYAPVPARLVATIMDRVLHHGRGLRCDLRGLAVFAASRAQVTIVPHRDGYFGQGQVWVAIVDSNAIGVAKYFGLGA